MSLDVTFRVAIIAVTGCGALASLYLLRVLWRYAWVDYAGTPEQRQQIRAGLRAQWLRLLSASVFCASAGLTFAASRYTHTRLSGWSVANGLLLVVGSGSVAWNSVEQTLLRPRFYRLRREREGNTCRRAP